MRVIIKKDQHRLITLFWNGKESEIDYDIVLAEPGASVRFLGLLVGDQADMLGLKITVTHAAPQTESHVIIKSALGGSSKVDISGLVKISPAAKGSKAWLAAHMLLLSDKAKGQAIPSLEIEENDIKAGHATTVGRVSDLEMFYLMSRGLSNDQAKRLIVEGFVQDVISSFPPALARIAQKELAS